MVPGRARRWRRKVLVAVVLIATMATSGCWDRVEIDRRGFVMAVSLDVASPQAAAQAEEGLERQLMVKQRPPYQVGLQLVVPSQATTTGAQSGGGGGTQARGFWNLKVVSGQGSVQEAVAKAFTRSFHMPDFGQLRVIVIGESLGRQGIEGALDYFLRTPGVRRALQVYAAPGEAAEALKAKSPFHPVAAVHLSGLAEHRGYTGRMGPNFDLARVARALDEGVSFFIPRIVTENGQARLSGSAVFKQGKLIDWLDEVETEGARCVNGNLKRAVITVPAPAPEGGGQAGGGQGGQGGQGTSAGGGPGGGGAPAQGAGPGAGISPGMEVCYVSSAGCSTRPIIRDGRLTFKLDIRAEGFLSEHQTRNDPMRDEYLEAIQREVARKLEQEARAAINKVQHQLRADIFHWGRRVEAWYPEVWRQIKDRWEEDYFPFADVEIKMAVHIRRVGLIK
ncbi:MAG: hypothetical protein H5U02_06070 [Clostridia bacterium]|nr:hypothetical protein [Clostridia bacterium]